MPYLLTIMSRITIPTRELPQSTSRTRHSLARSARDITRAQYCSRIAQSQNAFVMESNFPRLSAVGTKLSHLLEERSVSACFADIYSEHPQTNLSRLMYFGAWRRQVGESR